MQNVEYVRDKAHKIISVFGEELGRTIYTAWTKSIELDLDTSYQAWLLAKDKTVTEKKQPAQTAKSLEGKALPRPTWLVERLIPSAGLVAISGRPGSYKSFFALWLALRISEGLHVFDSRDEDFFCEQITAKCPVMFIEEENTEILVRDRMLGLKTPRNSNLHFRIDQGFKLGQEIWLKTLEEDIHNLGIKLVIMDPFSSVMGLEDENNNAEVSQKMDLIRKTFLEKGVTVIFLHHPSKGDDSGKNLRGAGDILGKCDVHLHLEKDEIDKKLVTVSYEKMRLVSDDQVQNFKMRFTGDSLFGDAEFRYIGAAKPKYEEARNEISEKLFAAMIPGEPMTKSYVAELVGQDTHNPKFKKAWAQLVFEGRVRASLEKKNGHPMFVRPRIG